MNEKGILAEERAEGKRGSGVGELSTEKGRWGRRNSIQETLGGERETQQRGCGEPSGGAAGGHWRLRTDPHGPDYMSISLGGCFCLLCNDSNIYFCQQFLPK